jgi:hypothetical protein
MDADYEDERYIPNEEMKLYTELQEAFEQSQQ